MSYKLSMMLSDGCREQVFEKATSFTSQNDLPYCCTKPQVTKNYAGRSIAINPHTRSNPCKKTEKGIPSRSTGHISDHLLMYRLLILFLGCLLGAVQFCCQRHPHDSLNEGGKTVLLQTLAAYSQLLALVLIGSSRIILLQPILALSLTSFPFMWSADNTDYIYGFFFAARASPDTPQSSAPMIEKNFAAVVFFSVERLWKIASAKTTSADSELYRRRTTISGDKGISFDVKATQTWHDEAVQKAVPKETPRAPLPSVEVIASGPFFKIGNGEIFPESISIGDMTRHWKQPSGIVEGETGETKKVAGVVSVSCIGSGILLSDSFIPREERARFNLPVSNLARKELKIQNSLLHFFRKLHKRKIHPDRTIIPYFWFRQLQTLGTQKSWPEEVKCINNESRSEQLPEEGHGEHLRREGGKGHQGREYKDANDFTLTVGAVSNIFELGSKRLKSMQEEAIKEAAIACQAPPVFHGQPSSTNSNAHSTLEDPQTACLTDSKAYGSQVEAGQKSETELLERKKETSRLKWGNGENPTTREGEMEPLVAFSVQNVGYPTDTDASKDTFLQTQRNTTLTYGSLKDAGSVKRSGANPFFVDKTSRSFWPRLPHTGHLSSRIMPIHQRFTHHAGTAEQRGSCTSSSLNVGLTSRRVAEIHDISGDRKLSGSKVEAWDTFPLASRVSHPSALNSTTPTPMNEAALPSSNFSNVFDATHRKSTSVSPSDLFPESSSKTMVLEEVAQQKQKQRKPAFLPMSGSSFTTKLSPPRASGKQANSTTTSDLEDSVQTRGKRNFPLSAGKDHIEAAAGKSSFSQIVHDEHRPEAGLKSRLIELSEPGSQLRRHANIPTSNENTQFCDQATKARGNMPSLKLTNGFSEPDPTRDLRKLWMKKSEVAFEDILKDEEEKGYSLEHIIGNKVAEEEGKMHIADSAMLPDVFMLHSNTAEKLETVLRHQVHTLDRQVSVLEEQLEGIRKDIDLYHTEIEALIPKKSADLFEKLVHGGVNSPQELFFVKLNRATETLDDRISMYLRTNSTFYARQLDDIIQTRLDPLRHGVLDLSLSLMDVASNVVDLTRGLTEAAEQVKLVSRRQADQIKMLRSHQEAAFLEDLQREEAAVHARLLAFRQREQSRINQSSMEQQILITTVEGAVRDLRKRGYGVVDVGAVYPEAEAQALLDLTFYLTESATRCLGWEILPIVIAHTSPSPVSTDVPQTAVEWLASVVNAAGGQDVKDPADKLKQLRDIPGFGTPEVSNAARLSSSGKRSGSDDGKTHTSPGNAKKLFSSEKEKDVFATTSQGLNTSSQTDLDTDEGIFRREVLHLEEAGAKKSQLLTAEQFSQEQKSTHNLGENRSHTGPQKVLQGAQVAPSDAAILKAGKAKVHSNERSTARKPLIEKERKVEEKIKTREAMVRQAPPKHPEDSLLRTTAGGKANTKNVHFSGKPVPFHKFKRQKLDDRLLKKCKSSHKSRIQSSLMKTLANAFEERPHRIFLMGENVNFSGAPDSNKDARPQLLYKNDLGWRRHFRLLNSLQHAPKWMQEWGIQKKWRLPIERSPLSSFERSSKMSQLQNMFQLPPQCLSDGIFCKENEDGRQRLALPLQKVRDAVSAFFASSPKTAFADIDWGDNYMRNILTPISTLQSLVLDYYQDRATREICSLQSKNGTIPIGEQHAYDGSAPDHARTSNLGSSTSSDFYSTTKEESITGSNCTSPQMDTGVGFRGYYVVKVDQLLIEAFYIDGNGRVISMPARYPHYKTLGSLIHVSQYGILLQRHFAQTWKNNESVKMRSHEGSLESALSVKRTNASETDNIAASDMPVTHMIGRDSVRGTPATKLKTSLAADRQSDEILGEAFVDVKHAAAPACTPATYNPFFYCLNQGTFDIKQDFFVNDNGKKAPAVGKSDSLEEQSREPGEPHHAVASTAKSSALNLKQSSARVKESGTGKSAVQVVAQPEEADRYKHTNGLAKETLPGQSSAKVLAHSAEDRSKKFLTSAMTYTGDTHESKTKTENNSAKREKEKSWDSISANNIDFSAQQSTCKPSKFPYGALQRKVLIVYVGMRSENFPSRIHDDTGGRELQHQHLVRSSLEQLLSLSAPTEASKSWLDCGGCSLEPAQRQGKNPKNTMETVTPQQEAKRKGASVTNQETEKSPPISTKESKKKKMPIYIGKQTRNKLYTATQGSPTPPIVAKTLRDASVEKRVQRELLALERELRLLSPNRWALDDMWVEKVLKPYQIEIIVAWGEPPPLLLLPLTSFFMQHVLFLRLHLEKCPKSFGSDMYSVPPASLIEHALYLLSHPAAGLAAIAAFHYAMNDGSSDAGGPSDSSNSADSTRAKAHKAAAQAANLWGRAGGASNNTFWLGRIHVKAPGSRGRSTIELLDGRLETHEGAFIPSLKEGKNQFDDRTKFWGWQFAEQPSPEPTLLLQGRTASGGQLATACESLSTLVKRTAAIVQTEVIPRVYISQLKGKTIVIACSTSENFGGEQIAPHSTLEAIWREGNWRR